MAVRDARWTYVWRLYEPPSLFDRQANPSERVDLAGCAETAGVEERFRDAILQWMVETSDVIPFDTDPRLPTVSAPFERKDRP